VEHVHIRRAAVGDEATVRSLRLQALSDAPSAFGSTYERELARTTADWQRWFSPGVTFILESLDRPSGLVAGVRDSDDPNVVHLMAMWVHPALRGAGAADALVASVLTWAVEVGANEVRLHVAKDNERARHCYERNGFRATGRESAEHREGLNEVEMARLVVR